MPDREGKPRRRARPLLVACAGLAAFASSCGFADNGPPNGCFNHCPTFDLSVPDAAPEDLAPLDAGASDGETGD